MNNRSLQRVPTPGIVSDPNFGTPRFYAQKRALPNEEKTDDMKLTCYESDDGLKEWFLELKDEDLRHREDGPAVVTPDGKCYYYLNDKELPFDLYNTIINGTPREMKEIEHLIFPEQKETFFRLYRKRQIMKHKTRYQILKEK